jgi:hypothetical protein
MAFVPFEVPFERLVQTRKPKPAQGGLQAGKSKRCQALRTSAIKTSATTMERGP